jgi:catechol 2,3-dioxygenase-like lactoylglutathione lyase family enzyme
LTGRSIGLRPGAGATVGAMLSGVHHVSLNVSDAEARGRFYVDGRQVHLIEVDGWVGPDGQHVAFRVDDIDRAREELVSRGVDVSDPFEVPGAGRQAFLKDPDGNLIELNQPHGARPAP